jgi:hypothetical protein
MLRVDTNHEVGVMLLNERQCEERSILIVWIIWLLSQNLPGKKQQNVCKLLLCLSFVLNSIVFGTADEQKRLIFNINTSHSHFPSLGLISVISLAATDYKIN